MPQLMPLMWMLSVVMLFLIFLMLIEMYNYNEEFQLNFIDSNLLNEVNIKW